MSFVIGIDGGGTKTAAVILDCQGRVLGTGEGGPSTYGVVPVAFTQASIAGAVQAAATVTVMTLLSTYVAQPLTRTK